MRRGSVLFAIAIALVAATIPATSRAAQTSIGIATDPILQPLPENGNPIEVSIGMHVVNISSIDEVSEQFEIDAYLFEQWLVTPGRSRRRSW